MDKLEWLNIAIDELDAAESKNRIIECFSKYLKSFGYRGFAFGMYEQGPNAKNNVNFYFASPIMKPWRDYYHEMDYYAADSFLRLAHQKSIPILWDIKRDLPGMKNTPDEPIYSDCYDFGIRKGVYIPVHGPNGSFSNMTIYELEGDPSFDMKYFHLIQVYVIRFFDKLSNIQVPQYFREKMQASVDGTPFTERELQCMKLTAENLTADEIAKRLHITPRTVNFHIQKVLKKLGARNKFQALSIMTINSNRFDSVD